MKSVSSAVCAVGEPGACYATRSDSKLPLFVVRKRAVDVASLPPVSGFDLTNAVLAFRVKRGRSLRFNDPMSVSKAWDSMEGWWWWWWW